MEIAGRSFFYQYLNPTDSVLQKTRIFIIFASGYYWLVVNWTGTSKGNAYGFEFYNPQFGGGVGYTFKWLNQKVNALKNYSKKIQSHATFGRLFSSII